MKQVSMRQLKRHLGRYLEQVKQGTCYEILEHSTPIARLVGIRRALDDEYLERLCRDGIITPARRRVP
jgi:prevent-host-death family protein